MTCRGQRSRHTGIARTIAPRVSCLVAHIRWVLHTPLSMLTGLGDMVCESSEQRALSTGRATAHSLDRAFVRPGLVQTRCMQNE